MKILVIGAGPSGCSSAYHLARKGHQVIIIAPKKPDEKVCGGGVPARCLERFTELYNDFKPAKTIIEDMVFSFDGTDHCQINMPGGMGIFSRHTHDTHLFEKALQAGAEFSEERFKSCERQSKKWLVTTDKQIIEADYLIGADGAVSRVRNQLSEKLPKEAYFKAHDYLLSRNDLPLHIGFDKKLDGYLWVFPRENNCSVGIVDFADDKAGRLQLLDDYLARFDVAPDDIIKKRSALIPSLRKKDLNSTLAAYTKMLIGSEFFKI